jgi:hypothetical protein
LPEVTNRLAGNTLWDSSLVIGACYNAKEGGFISSNLRTFSWLTVKGLAPANFLNELLLADFSSYL